MKKRSYALANEYARKVKEVKSKLKDIETLLNGKYDERLIQKRNILLTNIKTYESLSSYYGSSKIEHVDSNVVILGYDM
jgi:hypothetical protein